MVPPYLCQVNRRVSCAACCGLYNVHNLSADGLEIMLAARTDAFEGVARQAKAIEEFGRQQLGWTPEDRPFPHFHHCPYVGLIGRERDRVGCLLHPEAPGNAGHDWRALSYYGAKACRAYFCPTTERLRAEHQLIIRGGFDHWFLYGLLITEHRLWTAFFRDLEGRLGRPATFDDFTGRHGAKTHLQNFAALKLDWPFRRVGTPGPCHFFFDDQRNPRPVVQRMDAALPVSSHEVIFRELESCFTDDDDLRRAEGLVERILGGLTAAILNEQMGCTTGRQDGADSPTSGE